MRRFSWLGWALNSMTSTLSYKKKAERNLRQRRPTEKKRKPSGDGNRDVKFLAIVHEC